MSGAGLYIEEALLDVLEETDLVQFQHILCAELHLRRIEHFEHAKDKDLIARGIPPPAVRRLRVALADKKRKTSSTLGASSSLTSSATRKRDANTMNNENAVPETVIYKEQIKLMERLGEGTFAVVKRAIWNRPNGQRVDVAILRDASPLVVEELQAEAANLRRLQHPNLIQLYGVVEQPAMMVLELVPGGSLLDRLRERQKGTLLVSQLLDYCRQMCKGMTYLETKHCVHRDLAARNMLLSADEKTVKICDFGLMRCLEENERLYVMSPQKKVPFAWCPPEALRHRQFSHASDVWSMGVAMWEIFTYGEEPWVGLKGIDVLRKVEAGERLEKPRKSSTALYDLMLLCWKLNPDHRPRFNLLRGFLNQAEMPTATVRDAYDSQEEGALYLEKKDKVIVIENTGVLWFGQSLRTRLFGSFPRAHVFMESEQRRETTTERVTAAGAARNVGTSGPSQRQIGGGAAGGGGHSHITLPIKGSFIHAGHGDISGTGWGSPNLIDEIYLKNPVVGQPLVALGHTTPTIAPLPPPNKPNTLNISSGKGLNLRLDTPDSFDEFQNEDVSPSRIHIPAPLNGRGTQPLQATRIAPSRPVSAVGAAAAAAPARPLQPSHPYYEPPDTPAYPPMNSLFGGAAGITLTPLNPRDYGITPVPRPPAGGTASRSQSASRAVNNTPPPISATAYMNNRNTPPSSSGLSTILRPTNGHGLNSYGAPTSNGNGSQVMDELAARLQSRTAVNPSPSNLSSSSFLQPSTSGLNDSVQWRSSSSSNSRQGETPLLNHSQMSTPRGVSYMPQTTHDPFLVPEAIRTLTQPRRSEIIDAARVPQLYPSPAAAAPSTSSFPSSNLPKTSSSPAFNPAVLSSQPLQPAVIPHPSLSNPPSHRSSPVQQPVAPTPTPAPPPTPLLQPVQQQQPRSAAPPQQQQQQARPMAASSASSAPASRQSAIHEEVASFLPPPSALFYGSSNPPSARSSPLTTSGQQAAPQQTTSSTMAAKPTAPVAAAPARPAEAPFSSSVLQPTRIHNGSAATSSQPLINTVPAQPVVSQQPRAPASADISSSIARPYGLDNGTNAQMPLFAIQNSARALNSISSSTPYTMAYSTPGSAYGTGYYGSGIPGYYGDAAAALYGGYGTNSGYGSYGGYGYGSIGGGMPQTLIYPQLDTGRSVLPPALGPTSRSVEVPEGASREDVIRLLDPLASSSSTTTPAATAARSTPTAAAGAARPPSPGRQAAELEALYSEAFFTDRKRCDFMVTRLNGRVDLALRELKKEYLVDTGIARDKQQAEMALIAKEWNLNSAADAILTGAL